jgi:hypothetical protein
MVASATLWELHCRRSSFGCKLSKQISLTIMMDSRVGLASGLQCVVGAMLDKYHSRAIGTFSSFGPYWPTFAVWILCVWAPVVAAAALQVLCVTQNRQWHLQAFARACQPSATCSCAEYCKTQPVGAFSLSPALAGTESVSCESLPGWQN